MATTAPEHCHLCHCTVGQQQLPQHLRVVHEVMPGERTMADVPMAPIENVSRLAASERYDRVLAAGN